MAKSGILTLIAIANAVTWIIIILIGGYLEEWGTFFYTASWSIYFVLLSLILLKAFAGLNHEIHHNVGTFGKIGTLIIASAYVYITVIQFILCLSSGFSNPFVWLWIGVMAVFCGNVLILAAVFFAVYTGGVGIGE